MVGIAESCVLKSWVVNCSYLVEQIKCNLCCLDRLFLCTHQILNAKKVSLVKIHDCDVVEAAENIVLDLIFHEGNSRIERVMPCQMEIIDNRSKILVPVEMFGKSECVFGIHFNSGNEFIEDIHCNVTGKFKVAYFISELIDFSEVVSEGHGDLG